MPVELDDTDWDLVVGDQIPEGDIEIKYIGLRPAEKLYEELLIGSNVSGTKHPRICRADEDHLPLETIEKIAQQLDAAAREFDFARARSLLAGAVPEYQPENGIEDLIWVASNGESSESLSIDKIVEFPGPEGAKS